MNHIKYPTLAALLFIPVLLAACSLGPQPSTPAINKQADNAKQGAGQLISTEQRIQNANNEPANWLAHGRDYGEQRHSPLQQINRDNVNQLGLAWQHDVGSSRGLEATPIVVDGVMYVTSTWSRVMALDAKTGARLWNYDPKVDRAWGKKLCCDVVNRGVAVWEGKVYVGTLDGYLVALDARTGKPVWRIDTLIDRDAYYSITGAPRVVQGKVIIGNGGAEFDVRGYISAYDADSGQLAWRFYTVPGSATGPFEHPELAAAVKTWDANSNWKGAGGTAWDSMAYDAQLDLLYVGTGNGSPWSQYARSPSGGDNLYLASILALKPNTGELVWHYQTTPGDAWDYTATQHMILADLTVNGQVRKVLMQAPKNGFFYVLDRASGELISAEKYVFTNWASHIDIKTGRPQLTGLGDYSEQARYVFPSAAGGHNWQPMAYSPQTKLVYIPARDAGWVHDAAGDKWFALGAENIDALSAGQKLPPAAGYLKAWDPVEQKLVWQFAMKNTWNGGVLASGGGLVFHGTATGLLYAHNDATGEVLFKADTGTGMIAPPISYSVDGVQYIAIMAGWGGPAFNTLAGDEALFKYRNNGRVLVFKLGGSAIPLPQQAASQKPFNAPPQFMNEELVAQGKPLYLIQCGGCHGMHGSTPMLPDLRRMSLDKHNLFQDIVRGGILEPLGMSSFADDLSEQQVDAIHAYIVNEAKIAIE